MSEPDVEQASDASREDYYAWNVDDSPTSSTHHVVHGTRGSIAALRALLASHERLRLAVEALRPFAAFAEAFDAKPISGLDDTLYAIHTGTAWAAAFRLSDCRAARAALQQIEAEEPKWLPLPLGHHFDKDDHWPDHCAAYIGGSPSEDSSYCGRPASEHERQ